VDHQGLLEPVEEVAHFGDLQQPNHGMVKGLSVQ